MATWQAQLPRIILSERHVRGFGVFGINVIPASLFFSRDWIDALANEFIYAICKLSFAG